KQIADQLVANGGQTPYIGIEMIPVTDAVQKDTGLPDKNGAFVSAVVPNSPAQKAGVQQGDVVRVAEGGKVESAQDVVDAVRHKKVGQRVRLEVWRDGAKKTLMITVGAQP